MSPGEPIIERVEAGHGRDAQSAALHMVLRALPDAVREPFVAGLVSAAVGEPGVLAELWRCCDPRNGTLYGATWAQSKPGGVAIVWPSQWNRLLPSGIADPLLRKLLTSLAERGVTLAQSLLPDLKDPAAKTLAGCGFKHAVDLEYMAADVDPRDLPTAPADEDFLFEPFRADDESRLAAVVEQTYVETLDCPALDGLRTAVDSLVEYRTIGTSGDSLWRIVQRAGQDIGCLLTADHPSQSQVELVYMGIVPTARGLGGGAAMVREALRIAAKLGRAQVVLAVDATNGPAATIYRHHGFAHFETRTVMICRLATKSADSG